MRSLTWPLLRNYAFSDEQHAADWETGADANYDDAPQAEYEVGADPDYDDVADPDYEEVGQPDYAPAADPDYGDEPADWPQAAEAAPVVERGPTAAAPDGFAFAVGRAVLPLARQQAYPVLWRGQLKERHPATGLVQRTNVYRLSDGHWDCYREEELQAA